jgi:putative inorganic carbon (HCO3(-)) transporter
MTRLSQNIIKTGLIIYAIFAVAGISGITAGVIIGSIGLILKCIYDCKKNISVSELKTNPAYLLISGFIIILIVSTVFSYDAASSAIRLRNMFGEIILLLLILNLYDDEQNSFLKKTVYVMLILATVQSVYGITQYFTEIGLGPTDLFPFKRVHGTLGHYNTLGGLLGMLIPLFFVYVISSWHEFDMKLKACCITGLTAMTACLLLTFTRGAWLGVLASITIVTIIKNRKLIIIPFLIIIIALVYPPTRDRIINSAKKPETERKIMWSVAIDMIKHRPVIGYGLDTYKKTLYDNYVSKNPDYEQKLYNKYEHFHAHNMYLTILQETGLLGFSIFLCMIFFMLKKIIVLLKSGNAGTTAWTKTLALGILGMMTDFLVHGMVDYPLRGETAYMFWFFMGLLLKL